MPEAKFRIGLGLGANLGSPSENLRRAVALLREAGLEIEALSSLYRTPPWGDLDQPDFVNACLLARTDLAPPELLDLTQRVEQAIGRRKTRHWGPRAIDIDILFHGEGAFSDARLVLPHPQIARRAFVLLPLAEIAPGLRLGDLDVTEAARTADRSGIALLGEF